VELAAERGAQPPPSIEQLAARRAAHVHLKWSEEILDTPAWWRRSGWDAPAQCLLRRAWQYGRTAAGAPPEEQPPPSLTPAGVHRVIEDSFAETAARSAVLQKRTLRIACVVLMAATIVALVSALHQAAFRHDQAFGRPWRTSGQSASFDAVTRAKAGIEQEYFVETNDGQTNWAEVDLGRPTWTWGFEVRAAACCPTDAAPLSVESSVDGNQWRAIASTTTVFLRWAHWFWPRKARYVRFTRGGPTPLRLATVAIR
jgi:hypothetical protein